jgi:hypothetical protein
MQRTFWCKVYKDDSAFYPAGESRAIHCNHQKEGEFGINPEGEIVALPGNTQVQGADDATDANSGTVMVPQGTVFPSTTQFPTNIVAVTRLKDLVTLVTSYVDTTIYNTNVVSCNPAD